LATNVGAPFTRVRQAVTLIPAGGCSRLRIPFTDYLGRSVYHHCHILDHDDQGMTATVNVVS
jgi:FtsP/CotA-like multicopper oxidase with cupredoxin domain